MNDDLHTTAASELAEETGIRNIHLEQFHTFGSPKPDPREQNITIAHLALISSHHNHLNAASDADAARWFDLNKPPRLGFDHAYILKMAHERLLANSDYSAIVCEFLPEEFTLTEVQNTHEIIRQQEYDKRNFVSGY